jgi:hypothetical protein
VGGGYTIVKVEKVLKGQYVVKTRATQKEKNNTQHLKFKKAEYIR